MKYTNTWDLESIFTGGTNSEEVQTKLSAVKEDIELYADQLHAWNSDPATDASTLHELLEKQEVIGKGLGQVGTFINMWRDAFMDDPYASVVKGQVMELSSEIQQLSTIFTKKLVAISDENWNTLLEGDTLRVISFSLNEIREEGKRLVSEAEEKLIAKLNKDGLAAWSDLYNTVGSTMTVPFTDKDGNTTDLSIGQAMNKMYADPEPEVRAALFENWEKTWSTNGPIFADILNHLAGYRLTLQEVHGRKGHLEEPLEYNRMSEDTLTAMWSAVDAQKQTFIDYLGRKADLFGVDQLGWQDVAAPVAVGEAKPTRFTYDEACDFIIENFASFGPKLTEFTKHVLENRWVEAEDRANKRPGGYCTSLPEFEESRIFMTFTGSPSDTSTLAHELGHAFHSHVMKDLPTLNRSYAMNVAETASTFAETIIADATVRNATSNEEKISLLANKLEGATAMFLNIRARFLFEDNFYTERAKGIVSETRLNELMVEAQKEAFGDSLSSYHPHFWAAKLHFFIDSVPFYNFPYTFGYLFSLGIYAEYLKQPEGFEEKYIALLRDTGSMKVEDLAKKHLDVDITKEDFWAAGISLVAKDVEEFVELTDTVQK
ncbi:MULTISPECIES: M3 family oligoendopeptidase [unclassified Sporosarcina]|uniref:M3 family oligoendopeptidase n=1 Tax=unclassified Sporosarcina TaxID=2647733 RepID=UPI000C16CBF3|nr:MULTISPECIES: M3 family oligoendopeptidase [unclassified Sporosarcina]PID06579.1 oligoendopeptidase [Sporosarcina sp. P30]PID09773.1 oligoendopeptidase [Sporosarcina sp. P31]PID13352.1 oligoendopeptidase [Sporosarcina sp. P32b]